MGPVSFESLDGGATRAEALGAAARLADAGIPVAQMIEPAGLGRFRLVVPSADAARAREILSAHI